MKCAATGILIMQILVFNHLKLKQIQVNHLHSVSNNSNIKFEQVKSYVVLELMLRISSLY